MKTKKTVLTILAVSLAAPFGAFAEVDEPTSPIDGANLSAREAREKTRIKNGGEVSKVEVFTKPGGGQLSVEEVTEILETSGREYGITWKEDIVPAAATAIEDLAEALGTTRKELETVAKEAAAGGISGVEDARYALEQASKEIEAVVDDTKYALDVAQGELAALGEDAEYALREGRKEAAALRGDVEYAVKEGTKEINSVAGDLTTAGQQVRDDIKYAIEVTGRGDGVVGMIASALGCTTEELVDVVQYFGKEAKTIFNEISELPELRDMGEGVVGIAQSAEKAWVSNNGSLVAALDAGGSKVVIGQAIVRPSVKRNHRGAVQGETTAGGSEEGSRTAGQDQPASNANQDSAPAQ